MSGIKGKILIVGADSTIGRHLERRLLMGGHGVIGTTRRGETVGASRIWLNLGAQDSLPHISRSHFHVAVICSAITSVQFCEENPTYTHLVNVRHTKAVIDHLQRSGVHILFLSTSMVFDGAKPKRHAHDAKNPITVYGRHKADVEDWLSTRGHNATVIRFGKILTPGFELFTEWHRQLVACKSITPYANRSMAPISLDLAVDVLSYMVSRPKPGIFQVSSRRDITYSDAARYLASRCNADPSLVRPINNYDHTQRGSSTSNVHHYESLSVSSELKHICDKNTAADALEYATAHLSQ
jgi:dTDP-4-dehydrorhamnose reductase